MVIGSPADLDSFRVMLKKHRMPLVPDYLRAVYERQCPVFNFFYFQVAVL